VVEIKRHLFLVKQIITLLPTVHIKLGATEHVKSHRFLLSPSNLLLLPFTTCCTTPTSHSMTDETDQILHVSDEPIVNKSKSDSRMESDVPAASSSSNMIAAKMADKTMPEMVDYWKKTTVT
jgi:hypothetical protein